MAPSPLTEHQLAELRQLLIDKRRDLLAQLTQATHALEATSGSQAEYMDGAEQAMEEDASARRATREGALVAEIDHALSKFSDDSYGVSEDSGEAIPYERLRAVPWARRTVEEQEQRDRR